MRMEIDLSQLDINSESETLEFKESFSKEALETIGAFANAQGGRLLIGVRNDGRVIGISIGANTLEEWAQKIQAKIQPRILPSITVKKHKNCTIGVVSVKRSRSPVSVDGRYLKRIGRTNQLMSNEEIMYRILDSSKTSWDSQIEERANTSDLDEQAVREFLEKLNEVGRRKIPADEKPLAVLEKLRLIETGKPTRAAILLLGKEPKRFYPSAYIKAGRFKSLTTIVDDKEFDGTLFQQIEDAMSWFRDRLETRLIIGKRTVSGYQKRLSGLELAQREEVWEYPLSALREAVVNAVCHRNYLSGVAVTLRLYDDRLEIWNPGRLPVNLHPEDLLRTHDSCPPNRLIAEAFFNTEIIEKWGTGTLLIARALKKQGLPPPKFDVTSQDSFKLIIFGERAKLLTDLKKLDLNERQIEAVLHLQSQGSLTNSEYQTLFEASRATASRDLAQLLSKGLIIKEGSTGKGTIYRLAEA